MVDVGQGVVIPPEAPVPAIPTMGEALNNLSSLLFDIQDEIPNGVYMKIQMAAKNLFDAKKQAAPPPPPGGGGGAMDYLRVQLSEFAKDVNDLREENDGLHEQLNGATITIDRLRGRRGHYHKTTIALRKVANRHHISDAELLASYAAEGCLDQVMKDRESRKRAREEGREIELDSEDH